MIVYGPGRQPVEIGSPVQKGGEGLICPVTNQPSRLAKIYHSQNRTGRETKLRWMLANAPNDPGRSIGHASIAWPDSLVFDSQGTFLGYLMPRITNAHTLLEVFNPHKRREYKMVCDGYFLHRTARNLAAAVGALHAHDYVIGDLNECNILVTRQALVTIIDTDSFQTREEHDGRIIFYPCPVGRPEYTPPELQGKRFGGEVRQPEQDAFALAVLTFQILMGGSHPFRGTWRGNGDPPPIEERIYQGWFPYGPAPASSLVEPLQYINLSTLYPSLAGLFLRCFVEGHYSSRRRPLPAEWEKVLTEAEKDLRTCPSNHVYSGHLNKCPDCTRGVPPVPQAAAAAPVMAPVVQPKAPPLVVPARGMAPTPAVKTCVLCGNVLPAQTLYCPACASPVNPVTCIHCGYKKVPWDAKCCPNCGK